MLKTLLLWVVACNIFVSGCLITNCPRGGKRNERYELVEARVKKCTPCGPQNTGQCFGPAICCGPFGCLMATKKTRRCQIEGMFETLQPCISGFSDCRAGSGRCAAKGVCCSQDSCYADKECDIQENLRSSSTMELFKLLGL
ncbi:neurophysin 1-like [Anthonomus grandis grandis]|uniref:neurophysin 1-like n=1 Tax=Anthonomus grandis grandis TaxID=2921223 RepID=UPI0021654B99|nr:neurophysin 1-like [Anthonomus grandis grandis]